MSFVILGPLAEGGVQLPLCSFKVPAGFPSPAADHNAIKDWSGRKQKRKSKRTQSPPRTFVKRSLTN